MKAKVRVYSFNRTPNTGNPRIVAFQVNNRKQAAALEGLQFIQTPTGSFLIGWEKNGKITRSGHRSIPKRVGIKRYTRRVKGTAKTDFRTSAFENQSRQQAQPVTSSTISITINGNEIVGSPADVASVLNSLYV